MNKRPLYHSKVDMNKLMCCFVFFCSSLQAQQVYLSVDENGVPLYSDQAVAGAKKLELKVSQQSQYPQQPTQIKPLAPLTETVIPYQLTDLNPGNGRDSDLQSRRGDQYKPRSVRLWQNSTSCD